MIVEETSSSCRPEDDTLIVRDTTTKSLPHVVASLVDLKTKNSYNVVHPEGSNYSRAAKSMLGESDDEGAGDGGVECGEDYDGEHELAKNSRNPSLVDWSSMRHLEEDDVDHRDGNEVLVPSEFDHGGFCHGFPRCEGEFPILAGCQPLEIMACRHPLEIFSVFHDQRQHIPPIGSEPSERLLPGMHFIPRSCEYCGAEDTNHCAPNCQRPKSFFFKKRPPLCPKDDTFWDPDTDIYMPPVEAEITTEEEMVVEELKTRRSSLLLRNFFR